MKIDWSKEGMVKFTMYDYLEYILAEASDDMYDTDVTLVEVHDGISRLVFLVLWKNIDYRDFGARRYQYPAVLGRL